MIVLFIVALSLFAACAPGPGSSPGDAAAGYPNIAVEKNVAVPMRDGVMLRADIYRPAAEGRFPTLLYRTPYAKDDLPTEAYMPLITRAPRRGYAVVVQDARGRYHSEGVYRPYHQEGKDGYDTIEWAASQPWSNGRVGMFGQSYVGAVQWLAAMEAPPHLVSIFPSRTFASGRHFFYYGGAFNHDWMNWNLVLMAPDLRARGNLPGVRSEQEAEKEWQAHKWEWERFLPLREFPLLKAVAPWYYEWLEHPDDGAYWDFVNVVKAHPRISVPALNFSSWYDSNYGPLGAIANFNGMRARAATPEGRAGQKLILGPWDHAVPSEFRTKVGEIDFGPNATFDFYNLVLSWHDRWLKGIRNGVDESPPVRIFVMGENVWRDEEEWPLARAKLVPYYLRSGGAANGIAGDGRLSAEPPRSEEPRDRYIHDPSRPVVIENFEKLGPFDRSSIEARRDVLVYSTEPLQSDMEVTGAITATLWVTSSAPDTDFGVLLCDVHPDGKSYNLAPLEAGYLRARYRKSEAASEPLEPGEPTELTISSMVTSNLFRKGHRIRLHVSSSRFPVFDVNPNTGEAFGTSRRGVAARQEVLHDPSHPSRVMLPIIPR